MCVWLMFKISTPYAIASIVIMALLYSIISSIHSERRGMQDIFQAAMFQLSRNIQVFIQKSKKNSDESKWRPSAVCVSGASFKRSKALKLLDWIAYKYGFGTYIHLIEDYYSKSSHEISKVTLNKLLDLVDEKSNVYLDTLISPSYTSAIAQIIQLPSISGMENNMMIFEFDKEDTANLQQIAENIPLAKAGNLDICVLGSARKQIYFKNGIHVWIKSYDIENSNLMILLSYIILGHPSWRKGKIKIFDICKEEEFNSTRNHLLELIQTGRLPIAPNNIELIRMNENVNAKTYINNNSTDAGLTVVGFVEEQLKYNKELFTGYNKVGDILFVNASERREIR